MTNIEIAFTIFLILDIILYTQVPFEFRTKYNLLSRLIPGSGIYFFTKYKLQK